MGIVANKKVSARAAQSVAGTSSQPQGASHRSDVATRWKRVVPWAGAAVLVALAAVLTWRWAAARSKNSPHQAGNGDVAPHATGEQPAPTVTPPAAPETPLPAPEKHAAARPESLPHPEAAPAEGAAARSENLPHTVPQPPQEDGWPPYPLPEGYVKLPGKMATPDGRILRFRAPAEGTTVKVHSFGRTYECDSEGGWKDISSKPVFDNQIENEMVAIAMPGGIFSPAAILRHSPEEIDEILHKDVEIFPDDDEKTVQKKEAVAALKRQILEYMEEGGSFDEFVAKMREYSKEEKRLRNVGMNKLEDILERGDKEEARDYLRVYNELLQEQGFAPLTLSRKWREDLGLED